MRRVLPLLILLNLGLAPAPVFRGKPETSKDELKALQGEWECVRYSLKGAAFSSHGGGTTAVFSGARQSRLHEGTLTARWVVVLDPSKEPKWMDLKSENVPGQTLSGIYRLDGDTLIVAFRNKADATERPKDFRENPLMSIEVFRRKKP
jgi:uncharacterized protein (TIGR03067 family)